MEQEVARKKPISEETRRKLSKANMGKKNPMYGKHPSEETRRKMSEARTGEKNHRYIDLDEIVAGAGYDSFIAYAAQYGSIRSLERGFNEDFGTNISYPTFYYRLNPRRR